MKTKTFKGGIHPPERKELSEKCKIEYVIPQTKTVSIPVTQGGAPNQPIVKVGDVVTRGQKIAESTAFMSAPVHASISGIVKKIENRTLTGNNEAPCIIIESNDSDATDFLPVLDPFTCTKEEAIARVKEAGIVGMGGAAFPTHVKLNPPAGKTIEFLLVNAAECEPYLTIDYRTMLENTDKVIDGIRIAKKIVSALKGIIVLEDNKKDLIPVLEEAINKTEDKDSISICLVKSKYPQGGEKNIVAAATKREIPSGKLPADVGCVVQNVGTLVAISEAFREGKPLIERGLTISGGAVENPQNIKVPVGTMIGDLIPENITLKENIAKIISGGPMMGFAMATANFPVAKNTSGVLFLTAEETYLVDEDPCISCGRCVDVCSCRITPVLISRALKANDLDEAVKLGLMDCVECGSCAYVCPANVRLVQRFRVGKSLYRAELMKKQQIAKEQQEKATQKGDK